MMRTDALHLIDTERFAHATLNAAKFAFVTMMVISLWGCTHTEPTSQKSETQADTAEPEAATEASRPAGESDALGFTFEHWRANVIKSEEESAEPSNERPRKKREGKSTAEQSLDADTL